MSAETMRQAARYAIEKAQKEIMLELATRDGDDERRLRINQGRYIGLVEAMAIIDETYKGLGQ